MEDLLAEQDAIIDKINNLKRNYIKTALEKRTRGYASKRLENLDTYWETFRDNDTKLHTFKEFSKSDYAIKKQFDIIDELYFEFSGALADYIRAFDLPTQPNPHNAPLNHDQAVQQAAPPQVSEFRLPQISLPKFAGDYSSWSAFQDMFVSLIHSNQNLTNVQKLHYLKSNLCGQAANLLRHTSITNDSYVIAWESLIKRYENKRVLVDTQIKILVNQPSHHSESANNIRDLIDTSQETLNALRALTIDISSWDPLLLFIITQKLCKETHRAWETQIQAETNLPKFCEFITFLENRFRMLEILSDRKVMPLSTTSKSIREIKSHATVSGQINSSNPTCALCTEHHYLRACPTFLQMNVTERRNAVKNNGFCFNCLVSGHMINECKNKMNCKICNKRHHSLLHINTIIDSPNNTSQHINAQLSNTSDQKPPQQSLSVADAPHPNNYSSDPCSSFLSSRSTRPKNVLLSTAIVVALSRAGRRHKIRALIDPGSDASFITENAAQILGLTPKSINDPVTGIGNTFAGRVRTEFEVQIYSENQPDFALVVVACKMKNITGILPNNRRPAESWKHLSGITLADPTYYNPGQIDMLLGSDIHSEIILPGLIKGPPDTPIGQNTVFGWIISGKTEPTVHQLNNVRAPIQTHHTCINIDDRLKTFWEIEEIPNEHPIQSLEEKQCESHFATTHVRTLDGRYVVRLPLRKSAQLGESRSTATQRLHQLERRLSKDNKLKDSYIKFMREYRELGHMTLNAPTTNSQKQRYYIPHHAVIKESSSTTKLRVVFDASCKSNNGLSLNELLLIGPKLQDDLATILLRWRKFPYAFTADIEKMYRQILVDPTDQHLQHILWRESPDEPISEYALSTVTYGTSCAPHLAIRTLQQLAIDHKDEFPTASKIAMEDFYVDDLMTGSYSGDEALSTRRELSNLLLSGGFKLRKWTSNSTQLLKEIPIQDQDIQHSTGIEINNTVTALGIVWSPDADAFSFTLSLPIIPGIATKRNILSDISKIFDPLGWLSPIIIRTKILMQQLWLKGVQWDDVLPEKIVEQWKLLRSDLFKVNTISINRWIFHRDNKIELHGFSDASTNAYAAAIYSRIMQPDGSYKITLLTAKTRVAPLKQLSIPKLELCGAKLMSDLVFKIQTSLKVDDISIFAWTDSSIVLHWIKAQPTKWKTFVANRVSSIQHRVPMSSWRHVPTADNPADCASRGLDTGALQSFSLWWHGPVWLRKSQSEWPAFKSAAEFGDNEEPERRTTTLLSTLHPLPDDTTYIDGFSSIGKLLRVTAYCKRFISKCVSKWGKSTPPSYSPTLSAEELQVALTSLIAMSQRIAFAHDIFELSKNRTISTRSRLICLNPFLDENKILRVGGRLQHSRLPFDEKHPIILHNKCHLSTLIIRMHHLETMHGGPQLVLGLLRRKYWILNARSAVRILIYRCITCHRYQATSASQLMGSLPEPRVHISRPFTHTGVDYAGPIELRMSKGRGNASYKGYISLFVCLSTKAIHVEAVSDLTSNGFIAAYRRFVSRRGLPAHVYSDNGTNFVGAVKILRKSFETSLLKVKSDIISNATRNNTEWHFIPASSPHFGGLWEAGVKSLKHHLKRTVGNAKLTYEELSTVLTQIEACLNSRPLAPLTTDPNDFTALTPGHFLVGNALLSAPDPDVLDEKLSILTRWQLVQRMFQAVATRWQTEYLTRLQQRPKWTKPTGNIKVGDLVLVKDTNTSPSTWPLARITEVHPGTDNLVRVVTVRTSKSTFQRSITKICPLPQ